MQKKKVDAPYARAQQAHHREHALDKNKTSCASSTYPTAVSVTQSIPMLLQQLSHSLWHGRAQALHIVVLVDELFAVLQTFDDLGLVCLLAGALCEGLFHEEHANPRGHGLMHEQVGQIWRLPVAINASERRESFIFQSFAVRLDDDYARRVV